MSKVDKSEIHEIDEVSQMLKIAKAQGMEVEVVWSFANELRQGVTDLHTAATNALYEWDI